MVAQVEALAGGLREVARKSEQKIGEWISGLGSIDVECSVKRRVGVLVYLIVVKLPAELERVRLDDFGNRVAQI